MTSPLSPRIARDALTPAQIQAMAPIEQYFLGHASDDAEATRQRTLDWIEVHGTTACAKVTLHHGAHIFTDYFLLLLTAQGWKIANKAFHGQPVAA